MRNCSKDHKILDYLVIRGKPPDISNWHIIDSGEIYVLFFILLYPELIADTTSWPAFATNKYTNNCSSYIYI